MHVYLMLGTSRTLNSEHCFYVHVKVDREREQTSMTKKNTAFTLMSRAIEAYSTLYGIPMNKFHSNRTFQ